MCVAGLLLFVCCCLLFCGFVLLLRVAICLWFAVVCLMLFVARCCVLLCMVVPCSPLFVVFFFFLCFLLLCLYVCGVVCSVVFVKRCVLMGVWGPMCWCLMVGGCCLRCVICVLFVAC